MNYKGVCRTALATPGLLNILLGVTKHLHFGTIFSFEGNPPGPVSWSLAGYRGLALEDDGSVSVVGSDSKNTEEYTTTHPYQLVHLYCSTYCTFKLGG